jgi:Cys-tRNA(Pro)/Cys-tRNA(Cys) deacylase
MFAFELIVRRLAVSGVPHVIHAHAAARTVAEAEALSLFPADQFLKTVVFRVKAGAWVLAALRAHDSADYKRVAAAVSVKREALIRPVPEDVERELGFEAGAVGPFATTEDTTVMIDATAAQSLDVLYCGCGRADRTLQVRLRDLLSLTKAPVIPLSKSASPDQPA